MSEKRSISSLIHKPVRDAWPNEASDFTPWLSENLEQLEEVLGFKLELEGCEVAVDSFSADILAIKPQDGSRVLIENQLEGSDHKHLGQIMTYLSGLEANTVVWIATQFRDAHLSAINWLNENTASSVDFFAVALKVVQIGSSPYAPILEVVAKPNQWTRDLHELAGKSSELTKTRAKFWDDYVGRNPVHAEKFGDAERTSNRWHILEDLGLIISMYPRFKKNQIQSSGLFVRGLEEVDAFDVASRLEKSKSNIMKELETDHFWTGSEAGHFFSKKNTCTDGDVDCWVSQLDWLSNQADLYERVLRRYLA